MSMAMYVAGLRRIVNNAQVVSSKLDQVEEILQEMNGEIVALGLQHSYDMEISMLMHTQLLIGESAAKAAFGIEQYIDAVESYIRTIE